MFAKGNPASSSTKNDGGSSGAGSKGNQGMVFDPCNQNDLLGRRISPGLVAGARQCVVDDEGQPLDISSKTAAVVCLALDSSYQGIHQLCKQQQAAPAFFMAGEAGGIVEAAQQFEELQLRIHDLMKVCNPGQMTEEQWDAFLDNVMAFNEAENIPNTTTVEEYLCERSTMQRQREKQKKLQEEERSPLFSGSPVTTVLTVEQQREQDKKQAATSRNSTKRAVVPSYPPQDTHKVDGDRETRYFREKKARLAVIM